MGVDVHWHEGLFLQPHHLQMLQRRGAESAAEERSLAWSYPSGVVESALMADELENMRVRFSTLRAVMPSGIVVDFPNSAELAALDIRAAFESSTQALTVCLAVPVYQPGRSNVVPTGANPARTKCTYTVSEIERADDASGENPQPVQVRRVNARLMLDSEDRSDLDVLPLLRVVHGTGEGAGKPRVDPAFIPPCLVITGSPTLRELLRDLANRLEAARSELVVQLSRGGFNPETVRGMQILQLMRLRTLNAYAAKMSALTSVSRGVSPFAVYLELRALLGELAALSPDNDRFAAPAYDHELPAPVFVDLRDRIRDLLTPAATRTWQRVEFRREGDQFVAAFESEFLEKSAELYLGVRTPGDPRALAGLVENTDEFKLMPKSMAHMRVRGVRLSEERHPPMQLPSHADLHYFRLDRQASERAWAKVLEEKELAIVFPGIESTEITGFAVYATMAS